MLIVNKVLAANEVCDIEVSDELIEKCGKLLKTKKLLKNLKLSKLRNSKDKKLIKSKKLSKNDNSPIFDVKEAEPNFSTPEAKTAFNYL